MVENLVLLTGATGMIGFKTLAELLENGYTVRAAVRNQAGFDRISSLPSVQKYKPQLTSFIVPDITVPGAYDEAVKGVKYIVHIASPLAGNNGPDYENSLIRPAIQGTVGILESALKTTGIQRVVITASVASIASSARIATGKVVDGRSIIPWTSGNARRAFPHADNPQKTLLQSRRNLHLQTTLRPTLPPRPSRTKLPRTLSPLASRPYDVINIMPVFVFGRDETVTEASSIAKGTNGILMGPILGHARDYPFGVAGVHVDDVAKMHVLALDPKVAGNQDFLAASAEPGSVDWAESFEIVKRRYPEEYADGVFKFDSIAKPATTVARVDSTKATRVLGVQFKPFEEQVVSVVDHFLELIGRT
ncbi:hypothetical protein J3458_006886 [Metarhizium acridum]|nr:hypothetical protein J3458_006886 [Metarhizium acridum]